MFCNQDLPNVKPGFFSLLLILCLTAVQAQPFTSSKAVFEAASLQQKPVLLIFSGSDWCLPCINLKRKVLTDTIFKSFCARNLLTYEADFPQRKKLKAEQVADNEKLAERFNPKGVFPYVVLLRADQTILKTMNGASLSVTEWLKVLDEAIPSR